MFITRVKPTSLLGAALAVAAVLYFPGAASAQPGVPTSLKGYGLTQWQRTQGRGASYSRTPAARVYSYPQTYGYVLPASSAVVWSAPAPTAPAAATVAVRGPDGVVRSFPVEAGAVQQQAAAPGQPVQSYVNVLGSDGVVRSYPVTTTPAAASGSGIVSPAIWPCWCW